MWLEGHPQRRRFDHLIPRRSGPDVAENTVAACYRCTSRREARGPEYLRVDVVRGRLVT
jgi:5-methylcytosine-specific restriction endonuclease McrA